MDSTLFKARNGEVKKTDFLKALVACGAQDCDILYIHTGMNFGLPAMRRNALLGELLGCFESLGVSTLVFPTFTFSFCNNEPFDVDNTPTAMGAINEFARKREDAIRSEDPLLSICVIGEEAGLTKNLGPYSIGKDSSYDRLHNSGKKVKFLFFGADMRECNTFTHYVEAILGVPYRYNREFSGAIIKNGASRQSRVYLYSTYGNCRLNSRPVVHDYMEQENMLAKVPLGDAMLCCFSEKDSYEAIKYLLTRDPLCLTDGAFNIAERNTIYNPQGIRVLSVM